MVNIKEIQDFLKKIESNKDKMNYLKDLLDKVENKKLVEEIKGLIEDIKELDEIAQIEIKGKVQWSLPEEEESREGRRLERQVAFVRLPEEEKKEEIKVEYGMDRTGDLYTRNKSSSGVGYQSHNRRIDVERNPSTDRTQSFIEERVNQQFTGKLSVDEHPEDMQNMDKYSQQQDHSRGYSSLSEEFHDKDKKKRHF